MKFCDKLANLRKKNNITQEMLADKINVSRQAVSKWENGTSMPDMKTIMELCHILNCDLDDLIDDKAIGNKPKREEKFNLNNYLREILDFITKTYNMFCSMKLKEKIKCIFEMSFLILILFIGWLIIGEILSSIINPILWNLPDVLGNGIYNILKAIYILISTVSSFIIFIHLFKIRYLDYFVTITDETVITKTIEEAIEENKNRVVKENDKKLITETKKEKIIIRDPKHASYSFLNALGKLVILFCKAIALTIGMFAIISFVFLVFMLLISSFYIPSAPIFLGITTIILSIVLLNFLVIYLLYAFIFEQKLRRYLFISFITTLVLLSVGGSITFINATKFKYIDDINNTTNKVTKTTYIEIDETIELPLINYPNTKIIIDNTLKDVKIEITSLEDISIKLDYFKKDNNRDYFFINYSSDYILDDFKAVINMLKNSEWYSDLGLREVKVYISKDNLEILNNNL